MTTVKQMTPFREYVKSLGPKKFSEKYGIKYRTALAYSVGERRPVADSKLTRRLLAESPLTWDDIYPTQEPA